MSADPGSPPLRGHVVVGYDASPAAERALHRAAAEATRRGTTLEVVCGSPWHPSGAVRTADHGISTYLSPRQCVEEAADRVRKQHSDLAVVATLTSDPAATALVRHGRRAALTVVGSRGLGGFAGLLLGSVSLRVAARTECPLMVVRGETSASDRRRLDVTVAVQSAADGAAVRFGFEEARRIGARLRLVHAWQFPTLVSSLTTAGTAQLLRSVEDTRQDAAAVLREAVAPLREEYPDVAVRSDLVCGPPAAALVESGATADVLLLAAHRNSHHVGPRLGPVTHAVLHHAPCTVVLIPVG